MFISTILDTESGVLPVNTVAPAITGTAQEGQIVTCSTGTWTGTPTITFAYQWKRNGSNIGSATNSTYTLVTADVSQSITCQVTATNGAGSASATSNTITPIAAFDPDAQAFITAAAITDPTQQAAINTLVVDLKGYSIWSKMIAIYPFVGGDATKHSYNLKNTSLGQLTYTTGMTHGSLGIAGNSVGYANTGLKATTMGISQNSGSAGVYLQAYTPNQVFQYGTFGNFFLYKAGLTTYYPAVNNSLAPTYVATTNDGFAQSSRTQSNQILFKDKNNSVTTLSSASTALNSTDIWVCKANNYDGSTNFISYFFMATGLTITELNDNYSAVQTFQTTLGRQK
jgi:hypothetical protein